MGYDIPPRKLRQLGEGGYGSVWLVDHPHLRGRYAMKELRPEWMGDPDSREHFFAEASLWIALGVHPNLVNVQNVAISRETDAPYIVMEYVPPDAMGRVTLADHLLSESSSALDKVRWVVQCCDGLEFAAANGIRCHRDLKPNNILIAPTGMAKVGDFGLAVFTGFGAVPRPRHEQELEIAGTPPYMAPEQFTDPSAVDVRSDIYALGVVLYVIVGGHLPIMPAKARTTSADWQRAHLTQTPRPLDSPLRPVIERCLAKEQQDRYATYAELRVALDDALVAAGCTPTAVASAPKPTASDWNNRAGGLRALGRSEEAVTCYRQSVLVDPGFARAWSNLGGCLDALGQTEDARDCYARAQSLDPTLGGPWVAKAYDHHRAGELREALQCFDRALALEPADRNAWHDRGIVLAALGRWTEAVRSLRRALRLDPDSTFTRTYLAQFLGSSGAHRQAILVYGEILERRPAAKFFTRRAEQYVQLGDLPNANADLREALSLEPGYAPAHFSLGVVAERSSEPDAALAHYSTAVRYDPVDARAWHFFADLQRRQGLLGEAVITYERALAIAPERGTVWADAGACLDELGRPGEAHVYYREALRLNPNDSAAWWNRALLEARVGLVDEAAISYTHFLSMANPEQRDGIVYATEWLEVHTHT